MRAALRIGLVVLVLLALGACAPRDAHVPDFARRPYEAFSRDAVVAIALREWRLFGSKVVEANATNDESDSSVGDERRQGYWQRIGEYWWLGLNVGDTGQSYTGLHDAAGRRFASAGDGPYAWSAAFVSYVMRMAGAGPGFPYAPAHSVYINAAARGEADRLRIADPQAYVPRPGDLLCVGRGRDAALRYIDLPAARFVSHCDIVVGGFDGALAVIGGNVDDSVALKYLPTDTAGRLITQARSWLVVLQLVNDEAE